jgi:hypothetical protein
MKRERYHQLLSVLLDEDLWEGDADELLAGLREQPELQRDLRQHLILWDVWSQHAAEERSAEAFIEAWKTRVFAEAGAEQFSQSVLDRIGAPLAALRYRVPFWKRWRPLQIACAMLVLTFLAAAGWWAQQQFSKAKTAREKAGLLAPFGTNQVVTISGEGVCIWCVLHETPHPGPAIRIGEGGATKIVYLEFSAYSQAMHHYFAGGTTVTAKGVLREEQGRLTLTTQSVEVNGHELR